MKTQERASRFAVLIGALLLMMGVVEAQLPDWTGQAGATSVASSTWRRGFSVETTFSVVNIGGSYGSSPGSNIRYQLVPQSGVPTPVTLQWRISPTNVIINGDRQISLPGGTNNPMPITSYLVTPESLPNGNYTLRVLVDSQNQQSEGNEINNTFVLSTAINVVSTPDMGFQSPPQVAGSNVVRNAGESFTVAVIVVNEGDLVSVPIYMAAYYLRPVTPFMSSSTFFSPTSDDVFLGYRAIPAFTNSAQVNPGYQLVSHDFDLPSGLDYLKYRVGVVLDPMDEIPEYPDAYNNYLSLTTEDVTVRYVLERPDYEAGGSSFSSMSATSVAAGGTVTFGGRVLNNTSFTNPNITTIRHFIKRGPAGFPHSLGTSLLPPLGANGVYDFSVSLQIPSNLVAGEYSYEFQIDDAGVVAEQNEDNNKGNLFGTTLTLTPPVLPDLTTTGGQFTPSGVAPGASLTVQTQLQNIGFSNSGTFAVRYFLSNDSIIGDADDIALGARTVTGGLASGASATFTPTLTIPASTPYGQYRVGWVLDSGGGVTELSESNNSLLPANPLLTVSPDGAPLLPDLRPLTASSNPNRVSFEKEFTITATVQNLGTAHAPSVSCHAYLSLDEIEGNGDDKLLGSVNLGTINLGTNKSGNIAAKMPEEGAPVGMYRIVLVADQGDSVAESNETNNRVVASELVQLLPSDQNFYPMLQLSTPSVSPLSVLPNQRVETLVTLVNKGGAPAVGVMLNLVLSSDAIIGDADDVLLYQFGPDLIDHVGSSQVYDRALRIPDTTVPGSYYIGWHADPDSVIPLQNGSATLAKMPLQVRERRLQLVLIERDVDRHVLELHETETGAFYKIRSSADLIEWKESDSQKGNPDEPLLFMIPVDSDDAKVRYFHQGKKD